MPPGRNTEGRVAGPAFEADAVDLALLPPGFRRPPNEGGPGCDADDAEGQGRRRGQQGGAQTRAGSLPIMSVRRQLTGRAAIVFFLGAPASASSSLIMSAWKRRLIVTA
jgi:hypothetical protein